MSIVSEILANRVEARIVGIPTKSIAPAHQNDARESMTIGRLESRVEGVRRHVRRARRVAHQEQTIGVASVGAGVLPDPIDEGAHVLGAGRPRGQRSEPVGRADCQ